MAERLSEAEVVAELQCNAAAPQSGTAVMQAASRRALDTPPKRLSVSHFANTLIPVIKERRSHEVTDTTTARPARRPVKRKTANRFAKLAGGDAATDDNTLSPRPTPNRPTPRADSSAACPPSPPMSPIGSSK